MGTFHVIPKEVKEQILARVKNDGVTAAQAAGMRVFAQIPSEIGWQRE